MKKLYSIIIALLITASVFSQAPEKMSYQAVVRDASEALITNTAIGVQISILQGTAIGTAVYVETQTPTTNINGLLSLEIGTGTIISGDFTAIDWANDIHFIKTEIDITGGTTYTITGTSQLMSTPYALYAKTSGSSTPGPQGPAGNDGVDGAVGATGAQGPAGNDGAGGAVGATGAQGSAGNDGAVGAGAQGPAGNDGAVGATGAQGSAGNDGAVGATGAQGPAGNDGADGAAGATGAQGPAGNDGADGVGGVTAMTTTEKNAINSPATGLTVFDTTLGKFNYYDGTEWVTIESNIDRNNYVLVKSAADFPAAVGGVITLVTGTLYEINGTVIVSDKIDLNGCVLVGSDIYNDVLYHTGSAELFTGTESGDIKNLTLASAGAGSLFSLSGSIAKNILLRDCFVSGFNSLGTITGYNTVLFSLISILNCGDGVTFSGNESLYLLTVGFLASVSGTMVKLDGNFGKITFLGNIFRTSTGVTGLDVSTIGTINYDASIIGTSFVGAGTRTTGTFSKKWEINTPGIDTQTDDVASGTVYVTTPAITAITAKNTPVKAAGTTVPTNLFRFDTNGADNRLRYTGTKTRVFSFVCSFSMTSVNIGETIVLYLYKNGVQLPSTKISRRVAGSADIGAGAISGSVILSTDDYIELWVENISTTADITIESMNLHIK